MDKQSLYKRLVYQNIENALDELNAEDKGRYYICNCPECNEHEAFIYKNNTNFIQCNRENHCGERMLLQFHEKQNTHPTTEIGRASCRERVQNSGGNVANKKKSHNRQS